MLRLLTRCLAALLRFFLGGDIFISYARADGIAYAGALAAALSAAGLACSVDLWETSPAPTLPQRQRLALLRSRMLVLVATPEAAISTHVTEELHLFLETAGNVIPIDAGGLSAGAIWEERIRGLPITIEDPELIVLGQPSAATLTRIVNSAQFLRRSRRLQYAAGAAIGVVVIATLTSAWQFRSAAHSARDAAVAKSAASAATAQASEAKVDAARAREDVASATAEANREQALAKQARSAASQAMALADTAGQLANQRQKAAESMTVNARIIAAQSLGTASARWRAAEAVAAWTNSPNPLSAQLLSDALTTTNHYLSRFHFPEASIVVSRNSRFVAAWSPKRTAITVYELAQVPKAVWSVSLPELTASHLQALAISGDARHLGINVLAHSGGTLLIVERDVNSPQTGRVILRDKPELGRTLVFEDLAFSASGRYLTGCQTTMGLLSAENVPAPLIYDLNGITRRLSVPLETDENVNDIQISDDERFAVILMRSGKFSERSRATIFGLPEFQRIRSLDLAPWTNTLAFTPDGGLLLGVSSDEVPFRRIQDWRVTEAEAKPLGGLLKKLAHARSARRVMFLPNGKSFIVFSQLGVDTPPTSRNERAYATVFDGYPDWPGLIGSIANNRDDINSLVNAGDITSAGISEKGNRVATTDVGGMLTIWEAAIRFGVPRYRFPEQVVAMEVPQRGARIFISDLTFTNPQSNSPGYPDRRRLYAVDDSVSSEPSVNQLDEVSFGNGQAISPDGRWWARSKFYETSDHRRGLEIALREIGGTRKRTLLTPGITSYDWDFEGVDTLKFSPDGQTLVSVTKNGLVDIWNLVADDARPAASFRTKQRDSLQRQALAFSSDGAALAIASGSQIVVWKHWQTDQRQAVTLLSSTDGKSENATISALAVSAADKYLASATGDGVLRVWRKWTTPVPERIRDATMPLNRAFNQPATILDIAFHPNQDSVLAIVDRLALRVVNVVSGAVFIQPTRESEDSGATVRFSADGRYVLSSSYRGHDYMMWLWEPADLISDACTSFLLAEELTDRQRAACASTGRLAAGAVQVVGGK